MIDKQIGFSKIKRPSKGTWTEVDCPLQQKNEVALAFENPFGVLVFSSVALTEERKMEWHISISEFRKKPSRGVVYYVRECFGLHDFEEDNHTTTRIVSLWKPFVKDLEGECPCKEDLNTLDQWPELINKSPLLTPIEIGPDSK